jgi:phosphotransferase system HPr (HPr) family protein
MRIESGDEPLFDRMVKRYMLCSRRRPAFIIGRRMQERKVTVSNRLGLHARAAARVVRRASQYTSRVSILREDTGQEADGKSILSVLLLAASAGSSLIIRATGEDEERAANALAELVEQKFGEEFSDGLF